MNFSISLSLYTYIPLNSLAGTHHTNMVKVLLLTVASEYAPTNTHKHTHNKRYRQQCFR